MEESLVYIWQLYEIPNLCSAGMEPISRFGSAVAFHASLVSDMASARRFVRASPRILVSSDGFKRLALFGWTKSVSELSPQPRRRVHSQVRAEYSYSMDGYLGPL